MFDQVSEYASISLQGCGSLLLLVICWKLYKMKIHTLSRCFQKDGRANGIMLETMNTGSSREMSFTPSTPPYNPCTKPPNNII